MTRAIRKQYARALQMLHEGDTAFHATTPAGLRTIGAEGVIAPGVRNHHSPEGIPEVYFGARVPAAGHTSNSAPIVATSLPKVLAGEPVGAASPRLLPDIAKYQGPGVPRWASDWAVTPHAVPLTPKDTVIAAGDVLDPAQRAAQRLRVIDPPVFWAAMRDIRRKTPEHLERYFDLPNGMAAQKIGTALLGTGAYLATRPNEKTAAYRAGYASIFAVFS